MPFHLLTILGLVLGLVPSPDSPFHEASLCDRSVMHPLAIRLELEEDLRPSRWLTAQVTLESQIDLPSASITFAPSQGAEIQGPHRVALTALQANIERTMEIRVRVPDQREPAQVFATFEGEGPRGMLRRGTVLHMLPQGPEHLPEVVPALDKRGDVHRYRGVLRRIK